MITVPYAICYYGQKHLGWNREYTEIYWSWYFFKRFNESYWEQQCEWYG